MNSTEQDNDPDEFLKELKRKTFLMCQDFSKELPDPKDLDDMLWGALCWNRTLPITFWEEHVDKITWDTLCLNWSIPETFFRQHLDKVVWDSLANNSAISAEFFEEHCDLNTQGRTFWKGICFNSGLPLWFYEKYEHLYDMGYLCMYRQGDGIITDEFLMRNYKDYDYNDLTDMEVDMNFIRKILEARALDEQQQEVRWVDIVGRKEAK